VLWLVVSLKSSTDRRDAITRNLAEWGIKPTFVDAVDGRSLSLEERQRQFGAWHDREGRYLSGGEIGCFLSHYSAMQRFLRSDEPACFISEDDIELVKDPRPVLEIIEKALGLVDVVKLNSAPVRRKGTPILFDNPSMPFGCFPGGTFGTQGYAITRCGAQKALTLKKDGVIDLPLDDHLFVYRRGSLSIVECVPPVVGGNSPTTISGREQSANQRFRARSIMKLYFQIQRAKGKWRAYRLVRALKKHFPRQNAR
jgi:GR25 family glycosyltransferase involved in LPS biosynthesis